MTESNVQVSRAHVDGVPSPASSVQGGQLEDPFASRTGQALAPSPTAIVPEQGLIPGYEPGRNVYDEVMAPYKLQQQQDAQRQGEFVDSFLGSRDSVIDRSYATENTPVGQSMLRLQEEMNASVAERAAGAAAITSAPQPYPYGIVILNGFMGIAVLYVFIRGIAAVIGDLINKKRGS